MKRILANLMVLLVGVALYTLLFATPALATISNPDATSIGDAFAFRNILETGDILIFVRYDVTYATQPTENAEDTFLMAVYDTDGTTLLFTRPLNYYQHNIISVYLDADTNTLTWGSAYYIRIMGSPALFDPLVENTNMRTRVLSSGDYRATDDLGGIMVAQASILQTDWGTTLLTSGDKLNSTGSTYFLAAVPGLSAMVPEIFQLTTQQLVFSRSNYTEEGLNLTLQNIPVSLNASLHGLNQMLGITNDNWGGFGWCLLAGLLVGGSITGATKRPDIGVLGGIFGTLSVLGYMGMANNNVLITVMAIGSIIIVLFALEYVLPRVG